MTQREPGIADEMPPGTVDVPGFIDSQPVGRFQVQALLLCAAVLFMDGFDAQAIGYVAPELARTWGLPRATTGTSAAA